LVSKKVNKEQKELQLDKFFQEFQFKFNEASPEEKSHLATQFYSWAQQQVESLGVQTPEKKSRIFFEEHAHPNLTSTAMLSDKNLQVPILQNMKSLIENEIYLRQVAENIGHVIWLHDLRSNRILYVNPTFEGVWGRAIEDLYSDPSILRESVHPEDRVQLMVAGSHIDQTPIKQAYRILRPDGSLRWIFARSFMIRDEVGAAYCQFCIAEDVTDQKQVEMALRRTLDRTREQFELSRKMSLARKPEAVLKTLMSAHELRSAQRAALLFFDNPKVGPSHGVDLMATWLSSQDPFPWMHESDLYEEPALSDLLHPSRTVVITGIQSDPRLTPALRDFLLDANIQTLVIFPMITLGEWLGCLLVYFKQEHHFDPIELRHLKVLVGQATITLYNLELLKVEEASRHEAERANEIKTEFLAMISHELRTPLTSIVGFTTTLLADDVVWDANEQRDFFQTIQLEADRLQELIDHLLDLSRLEAGMLPISQKSHSLPEIIEDALPQLHVLTVGQSLTMQIPTDLPPVYVDAKRIAQVLVNLVRNASIYSPKGTEISISASVRGGFVQVNVSDEGPGIPTAERKRVFQAFRRGQSEENDTTQGAGLGLAICKGLVEAHGGRIWIKKKNTPGAIISLTIPLVYSHSPMKLAEEER
jgi:PAS domain S-box-containing protein